MILMTLLRESPRWLIGKNRLVEAEKSMQYFRDTSDCKMEMDTIINDLQLTTVLAAQTNETLLQKLGRPEVFKPLGMLIGLGLFQQYSGLYTIVSYAVKFCIEAGVTVDPFLCSIGIGLARMLGSYFAGSVMDHFGRKWPTIMSSCVIAVCMYIIGVYTGSGTVAVPWLPVLMILIIIFASSFGLLTIPYLMIGEIFPLRYRGLSSGLGVAGLNCATFSMLKMYPSMIMVMGSVNVFYFFGTISLISVLYVHFVVIETKGKTLEEIELSFKKK